MTTHHYGNHPERPEIEPGQLAYWSTVRSGLVPCKVVELIPTPSGWIPRATIKLTASRAPYCRGETHVTLVLNLAER